MNSTPQYFVPFERWEHDPQFLDFLKFSYRPSRATAELAATLLPIAVSENRMLGSLRTLIIKEALAIWNEPETMHHFFHHPSRRWIYRGTDVTKAQPFTVAYFGRLSAPLRKGVYCPEPRDALIFPYRYPMTSRGGG